MLIELRRNVPSLTDPRRDSIDVTFDEEAGWLVFKRPGVSVVLNLGQGVVSVPLGGFERLLLASEPGVEVSVDLATLPPDTVGILGTASP